jgi:hypothetical protein
MAGSKEMGKEAHSGKDDGGKFPSNASQYMLLRAEHFGAQ